MIQADHTFAGPKDSAPAVAVLQPTKEENPLFKPQTKVWLLAGAAAAGSPLAAVQVDQPSPAVNVLQACRRQRPLSATLPPASVPQTLRICTFNVPPLL